VVSLEGAGGAALPDVVFVKDPEGWRRHSFFVEVVEVAPPKKPGG
jgi:hypothetical protein